MFRSKRILILKSIYALFVSLSQLTKRCNWPTSTLIFLISYKLYFHVTLYLSWPVSIRINVSYVDSLKFPTVTVCNYNRYRKSKIFEAAKNSTNLTEILTSIPEPAMSTWENRSLTIDFYQNLAHQMRDTIVEVS